MSKLVINLKEGLLEIESDNDRLIEMVYSDFKSTISNQLVDGHPQSNSKEASRKKISILSEIKPQTNKNKRTNSSPNETFNMDPNLDLWKTDKKTSLKDFYAEKNPSTGYECNAVFIYYMQRVSNLNSINLNHIYTCYKEVNRSYPTSLRQNLTDTKRDKGWINTSNFDALTITPKGENYVEHSLPKAKTQ